MKIEEGRQLKFEEVLEISRRKPSKIEINFLLSKKWGFYSRGMKFDEVFGCARTHSKSK